ncbi:MAG: signal recognition particle-docking protein FtsY [Ferroplasma sp.]
MFDKLKKKFSGIFKNEDNEKPDQNMKASSIEKEETQKENIIKKKELESKIEESLLESDVNYDTVEEITEKLTSNLGKIKRKVDYNTVQVELRSVIKDIITDNNRNSIDLLSVDKKPYVILFLGINGTGKTTTIGKLAYYLKENGKKVVISASDTFRAGAIEQINIIADKAGVELIKHNFRSDPASVAFDAIDHARARGIDFVIIDSAGRMQTNKNLLDEMKKIKRVAKPDLTILVLDAMIGQDVIEQAKTFSSEINYDAIILTKLDTDAKGGSIITISSQINKPIIFIGTGQELKDLMPFNVDWYLDKIFST